MSQLLLLLGDQLDHHHPELESLTPHQDTIIMAELASETHYVSHNKLKIALIFSAMRHFAADLTQRGFKVGYYPYTETEGRFDDFNSVLNHALAMQTYRLLHLIEAGEFRLQRQFGNWQQNQSVPVTIPPASHFIFAKSDILAWFNGCKVPRMAQFYRWARQQTGLLMQGSRPQGGQYNVDKDNRHADMTRIGSATQRTHCAYARSAPATWFLDLPYSQQLDLF